MTDMVKKVFAGLVLSLILNGHITHPDQLPGKVNETDLQHLSGAMEIENGNRTNKPKDDIRRLLLTGSVVLNRVRSDNWSGNTIEKVILAPGQYAPVTRNGFKTKKATERTVLLAKYLLIYGPICPENVVYQGQSMNGSGLYESIEVKGDKDELFCFE